MKHREALLVRRLLFGLLIPEGLRVSEALSLTWRDVDLERDVTVGTGARVHGRGLGARRADRGRLRRVSRRPRG